MKQSPRLKAALGLCLGPCLVLTTWVSASLGATVRATPSEGDTPLCYMRTPENGILDLSHLCNPIKTPNVAANPQVVVLSVKRMGDQVTGQVRNDTGKPVRFVIVNYAVASTNGAAEASFTFATPETLAPGQVGSFQGSLNQPGEVTVTSVEWDAQETQANRSEP